MNAGLLLAVAWTARVIGWLMTLNGLALVLVAAMAAAGSAGGGTALIPPAVPGLAGAAFLGMGIYISERAIGYIRDQRERHRPRGFEVVRRAEASDEPKP